MSTLKVLLTPHMPVCCNKLFQDRQRGEAHFAQQANLSMIISTTMYIYMNEFLFALSWKNYLCMQIRQHLKLISLLISHKSIRK